jgi:hypothetical protein
MAIVERSDTRPLISFEWDSRGMLVEAGNKVFHTYRGKRKVARVEFRKGMISVGCTDISIEAARFLVAQHAKYFPDLEEAAFVHQEGEEP